MIAVAGLTLGAGSGYVAYQAVTDSGINFVPGNKKRIPTTPGPPVHKSEHSTQFSSSQHPNGQSSVLAPPSKLPEDQLKTFTLETLEPFTGENGKPVYLAFNGKVFDVTASGFYGKGSAYHIYAGRDATRGLSRMEMQPDFSNRSMDDFTESEHKAFNIWEKKFSEKYQLVGYLN